MLKFESNGTYFCNCEPAVGTYSIDEPGWHHYDFRIFYKHVPEVHRMDNVQDVLFISADTILLVPACRDRYSHIYVRVN